MTWTLIAAMGIIGLALLPGQGMTVAFPWRDLIVTLPVLWAIRWWGQRRDNVPGATLANLAAQLLAFSFASALLSYVVMAATPFPLADDLLSRTDAALGFDWLAWFHWVGAHPTLHLLLRVAYGSVPAQASVLFLGLAWFNPKRIDEAMLACAVSVPILIVMMAALPAVGAWSHFGVGVEPWRNDILALRAHALPRVEAFQGIVAFPSFHTIMAVLLAYMTRGSRYFLPVLLLNCIMILSVMTEGAHYGVDVLGGLLVAWVSIVVSRSLLAPLDADPRLGQPAAVASPAVI